MKLVRYSQNGQPPRLGTLLGADRVMDLESSATAYLASRGVVRAGAIAAALLPHGSTRAFLEGGSASQDMLAAMTDAAKSGKYEPVSHPLGTARLHAPIADPGKFICIGLNYKDHAAETNNPAPKEPPIFPKWSNAIADPGEPVLRPRGEKTFDWEVELGVVIGRTARFVKREQALDYVFGYTIINDVTARDLQKRHQQWFKGKSLDTFCPMGPVLVTADELPDPQALAISLRVNGQVRQSSNTAKMIFPVAQCIEVLSQGMTLLPGDIIATGTPEGVGAASGNFLKAGDRIEAEVEHIGVLHSKIVRP